MKWIRGRQVTAIIKRSPISRISHKRGKRYPPWIDCAYLYFLAQLAWIPSKPMHNRCEHFNRLEQTRMATYNMSRGHHVARFQFIMCLSATASQMGCFKLSTPVLAMSRVYDDSSGTNRQDRAERQREGAMWHCPFELLIKCGWLDKFKMGKCHRRYRNGDY